MSRQITDLEPKTQELCVQFLQICSKGNRPMIVVQTYRSFEEQEAIYAQGRTRPGPVVTHARAGDSWHNYRRAFDVCFMKPNGNISWDGDWEIIGEIGESLGLEWGGRWSEPDRPHLEYHPGLLLVDAKRMANIPKVV